MKLLARVPLLAITAMFAVLFLVRARLLDRLNINWDEFHFVAQVHSYLRGELTAKLLTFHVHLFPWVTQTSPNEAIQVLHLREVLLVAAGVSSLCLAFVGWRLLGSATAAVFAVFVGQATSYLLNHGASARFDSVIATLFAVAAALLAARARGGRAVVARVVPGVAGVVFAVAVLVSIKSLLFVPVLLGIALWPVFDAALGATDAAPPLAGDARRAVLRSALIDIAVFALAGLAAYGALYALHVHALADVPAASARAARAARGASLLAIGGRQFTGEVLPTPDPLIDTLRWDVSFWALFGTGGALAFMGIGAGGEARRLGVKVLFFALPLAAVALYRNAFSYFYVCVLPSAAMLAGLVVLHIERAAARRSGFALRIGAAALIVVLASLSMRQALRWFRFNSDDQVSAQVHTIDVVHAVFAEPVPYIDRCSMIGSFKKVGPFMTTWVMDEYRSKKKPMMAALLQQDGPHFLLQNIDTLEVASAYSGKSKRRLLKEDYLALRDAFIPHWGPLWVAGTAMELTPTPVAAPLALSITGSYRVELKELAEPGPVLIDTDLSITIHGKRVANGDVIKLTAGSYDVVSPFAGELTLRIASAAPPPAARPPAEPLFTNLAFRTELEKARAK